MSDDINVGQLSEAINNKMDRDMGNQSTGIHHIIETYVSGTSGYRIWDDGYCEQWGQTNGVNQTVSFLKIWKNTNYNVLLTAYDTGTGIWSAKTTGTVYIGGNYSCWLCSGYLAEGEY